MPQTKTGIITSTKMKKTAVVAVTTYHKHPLYKKLIKKTTKIKARDDIGVKVGQKVKIRESRPLAKDVHFKILETIK